MNNPDYISPKTNLTLASKTYPILHCCGTINITLRLKRA